MEINEAINVIVNATGQLQGTRKDHEIIANAINSVKNIITELENEVNALEKQKEEKEKDDKPAPIKKEK